jgi:hypothetical protein
MVRLNEGWRPCPPAAGSESARSSTVPAPCPRTMGTQAGNFALLPPDWSGTVPAEFTSIGALKRLPRRAEADGMEDTHPRTSSSSHCLPERAAK